MGYRGRQSRMRSPRANVELAIERLWGGEVDGELLDAIVEEAVAWGDHHAAIVAASHRILAARGGIAAVGFDVGRRSGPRPAS